MDLKEFKKEMFKENPKIKEEYDKLELEYKIKGQLIELRRKNNLTQKQLADLLKTKQSNIARIESGSFYPSLRLLEKIADVLNTKLDIRFIPKAS
ncbi:MAG: helix-turn-helix domain-containing protein [Actinomycetia bacterium]|nr:helix-turn-helix domain-containing protein [Actinomycetota bacterium]MCG2790861.1 helix-turn-helix domain-containing protein [Actinomycetes bacterium]